MTKKTEEMARLAALQKKWAKIHTFKEPLNWMEELKPRVWGCPHVETEGVRGNKDYRKGGRGCLGG